MPDGGGDEAVPDRRSGDGSNDGYAFLLVERGRRDLSITDAGNGDPHDAEPLIQPLGPPAFFMADHAQ